MKDPQSFLSFKLTLLPTLRTYIRTIAHHLFRVHVIDTFYVRTCIHLVTRRVINKDPQPYMYLTYMYLAYI